MGKESVGSYVNAKVTKQYTVADIRAAFAAGAQFSREHIFNPSEMNAVKAAEESMVRWPD